MTKQEITQLLEEKHQVLFDWLAKQPDENWLKGPKGKWTTGQHIQHLVDSNKLLNKAFSYPKFILKYKFGKRNRAIRDYQIVKENYCKKLKISQEKATEFNKKLRAPSLAEKASLLTELQIQQKKLQYKTNKWKDTDLDNLLLPHPLMGRMVVREIIMWTATHVEGHTKTLIDKY